MICPEKDKSLLFVGAESHPFVFSCLGHSIAKHIVIIAKSSINAIATIARTTIQWFATYPEKTFVLTFQHGMRILSIFCTHTSLGRQHLEAHTVYDEHNVLEGGLDAVLMLYITKMVQQRAQVDPDATRNQNSIDCFNKVNHIICTVDKETRGHAVVCVRTCVNLKAKSIRSLEPTTM